MNPLVRLAVWHMRILRLCTRDGTFGIALLGRFFPEDGLAVFILPQDARIHAAARSGHGAGLFPGAELVMLPALHRQRARPAADPVLA